MTMTTVKVLTTMLGDIGGHHYGYDLMKQVGIGSGTLYPLLARLEQAGLIESNWEEANPNEVGRGKRKYYALTSHGQAVAQLEQKKLKQMISVGGIINV
ncbi:PadR family transcriptional regulator [Deinococcus metallilatus]|nr:PadR family transcriptional regulator [Deinococcus metallilatus]MBB5297421.1 DNA-binding PadR family transcriptional regulator [Deinococcus metallilatus]